MRLFCKTWEKDFQWLKLAMVSVRRLCREPVLWNIVVDDGTREKFKDVIVQVEQACKCKMSVYVLETSEYWKDSLQIQNGYLRQQWIKMTAHRAMGTGYFWNWDSDVIAQREFSSNDFCGDGGLPIHWLTQFNSLMNGTDNAAHEARKQMLRDVFGVPDVAFEYMRCMPMPMMSEILKHAESTSYWKSVFTMCVNGHGRVSEFNIIGMFSHLYFPDCYEWRNTQNFERTFSGPWGDKKYAVSQHWSWGGCPKSIHDEVMNG